MRRCARDTGDPERVHQLRVATRRIDAVLRLFAPRYPPRRLKKARKRVRRMRQSARQVRDLDVLLDRLQSSDGPASDLSALTTELRLRRDDAVHDLGRALRKRRRKRLRDRLSRLRLRPADGERSNNEESLASFDALLLPCIDAFRAAAAADLTDTAALHRFRLRGKRLRYTLELLAADETGGLAMPLIGLLRDLQEQLGHINDHATARDILASVAGTTVDSGACDQAGQLAERETRALEEEKRVFMTWWTEHGAAQSREVLSEFLAGLEPSGPSTRSADG
jgi:CHAD domain-containing protein